MTSSDPVIGFDEASRPMRSAACVAGDAEEIASLRTYLRRRLRDPADVDDMVQDVYLRVLSVPQAGIVENTRGFL